MARKRKELCGISSGYSDGSSSSASRGHLSSSKDHPLHRNAANARERARMRVLSRAFSRLKTSLPWVPADTKLSKLDTLRLASSYIAHLRDILTEDDAHNRTTINPISLTWPFSFPHRVVPPTEYSPTGSNYSHQHHPHNHHQESSNVIVSSINLDSNNSSGESYGPPIENIPRESCQNRPGWTVPSYNYPRMVNKSNEFDYL